MQSLRLPAIWTASTTHLYPGYFPHFEKYLVTGNPEIDLNKCFVRLYRITELFTHNEADDIKDRKDKFKRCSIKAKSRMTSSGVLLSEPFCVFLLFETTARYLPRSWRNFSTQTILHLILRKTLRLFTGSSAVCCLFCWLLSGMLSVNKKCLCICVDYLPLFVRCSFCRRMLTRNLERKMKCLRSR